MTHYRWHVGSVSIILKRQLPCSSGLREKVFSSEQFKPQLPYYLSLSFPNQRNLMLSRSHILQVSQGFGLFALGLFGLKFWLHENANKIVEEERQKNMKKMEEAYFCQVFPGLVVVRVLSGFVWICLSFVRHGLRTSVSNLVNLCIWKRHILK